MDRQEGYNLCIRVKPTNKIETINYIESIWKKYGSGAEMEAQWMEDYINENYHEEFRRRKVFNYFSSLSIIISCLGLFGLASFMSNQRIKEMGIRKALGASAIGIIKVLSKEFAILILIGNIIAWPISWYLMNKWLQNFTYKTSISWWIFILGCLISLIISLITVFYHAFKSSRLNPANALQYE